MATLCPGFTCKLRSFINSLSLLYEKFTLSIPMLPSTFFKTVSSDSFTSTISSSFIKEKTLALHAIAFCNSVITPEISLKGLVY